MHLAVIVGSPRAVQKSNTAKIMEAFLRGFEAAGNTSEAWYLAEQKQWHGAKKAYEANEHILIALPLFVENIPGILLEFLEQLSPKAAPGTKMAFLMQGGFAEASQLRCGEAFLETLPAYLNCEYAGTLIKGDNFAISFLPEETAVKMTKPYEEMGKLFAQKGSFAKEKVTQFAAPEYFSAPMRVFLQAITPVQNLMLRRIAKSIGCKEKLDAKPYQACVSTSK